MVAKVKIFRNNKILVIPIQEFFDEFHKELPKETKRIYEVISQIFDIKTTEDYLKIYDYLWIDFNYHRVLIKYEELKKMNLPFEDDIIKFISFLYGTQYFIMIGFPDLEVWLNAKDFNHPFEKGDDPNEGCSLLDAVKYEYGQNAVRVRLGSALKLLGPQCGEHLGFM